MKLRIAFVLSLTVLFLSAFAFADGKDNCTMKGSASNKSSCCTPATKASMTSDSKSDCKMDSKECTVKNAKMSGDCPMMTKSGKSTMKKTGGMMDCCKGKSSEAKNGSTKSNQPKSTEIKATN